MSGRCAVELTCGPALRLAVATGTSDGADKPLADLRCTTGHLGRRDWGSLHR